MPAIARESGAILKGPKCPSVTFGYMLRYGVTASGLNAEAAGRMTGKEDETGATDKYELGNRPRMIRVSISQL